MRKHKVWKICYLLFLSFFLSGCSGAGGQNKIVYISVEEAMSFVKTSIEVTTENWNDYFEITEGKLTEEKLLQQVRWTKPFYFEIKDGFYLEEDEVTFVLRGKRLSNQIYTYVQVGESVKPEQAESETRETVELENIEEDFRNELVISDTPFREFLFNAYYTSDQTVYYNPEDSTPESITMEELEQYSATMEKWYEIISCECEAVSSCNVRAVIIPEEMWNEEEGVRYLCVGTKEKNFRIYEWTFQDDYRRFLDWAKEQ